MLTSGNFTEGATSQLRAYIDAVLDIIVERLPRVTVVRLLKATIIGLLVVALLMTITAVIGLVRPQAVPVWLQNVRVASLVYYNVVAGTAFVVGGLFVWYKFIRRGDDQPRIQPTVTGRTVIHGGVIYVIAIARAQNTGVVNATLDLESSALELYTTSVDEDAWKWRYTQAIFKNHGTVEPDELIEDQIWFEIPYDGEIGVKLDLNPAISEQRSYPTTEILSLLPKPAGNDKHDER